MGSLNKVILVGQITKSGMAMRYSTGGTPCASFTLQLSEVGQDNKVHTLFIDCECWGKKAEAASTLEAGMTVLFEGKLARRKKGESWDTVIAGYDVTAMVPGQAVLSGSAN